MIALPHIDTIPESKLETLGQCPQCQSSNFHELFTERGFPTLECEKCEFIFLGVRLKEEFLSLIYDKAGYHNVENSNYLKIIGRKRLELLPSLPEGARVHEDAAGNGAFLNACKEKGYLASGNDLGQDSINKAKQAFNIELSKGTLMSLKLRSSELDAFAGFNILCHLYDPWSYLAEVSRLLKPGGYAILRTGNRMGIFKMLGHGNWGAPEHVYHFSVKTLTPILNKNKMSLIWVKPAFDSDFPYFLFNFSRQGTTFLHKAASYLSSGAVRAWTALNLPKDDVYLLAQKTD